ncbi:MULTISPECIES: TraI domain-containing protein [Serratia]|uniref:TraI domain-containing protein n=1 Tax=Serratia TaxID=613 RepID=UPI001152F3AD|nr:MULTISPECIES: TraI domain-containing protein [Serratia]MBH2618586.1 TraI domain-containing protein [Serratia ureilytica]MBH3063383.1 TraI domain-containing protein [Serratia ureilytica]MBH3096457.1 TraI domain-containing protein [Serratia ureilytica]MBH3144231.1 TraI domain-containing protein [Serratia ureilytica]MBJ2105985.1 TraI domain-containing protein [Serratia ureilytica]
MLKAIKEMLVGTREIPARPTARVATPQSLVGYFMPATAEQLLDTASRKQCLQQLWENSALPKDLYADFYLQPLKQLMTLMQVLPAAQQGEYAREGGLAEVTLQTVTYAVRLAKGHMLPPGAAPEEQAAQNVQWNMVVFYAALWHYLPLFSQLEGELRKGPPWLVGVAIPTEPYRFRFAATSPDPVLATSQSTMIAARLLPAAVIDWLSALPAAIQSLMLIASRQPSALPVIDDIVQDAVRLARGEDLLAALQGGGAALVRPAVPLTSMVLAVEKETFTPPVSSIDKQSTVSSTHSPLIEGQLPTEIVGPSNGNVPSATDALLSSALDTPVNDKPLAEMKIEPEPVVGTGEDIQALLSLMAVEVSAPVNQTEQTFGDALHENEGPMPANNPVLTVEVTQEVEVVEANLESDGIDDIASKVVFSTSELGAPQIPTPAIEVNGEVTPGEAFWRWLADGLNSNQILINTAEARVHLVSGFIFITVPGVFYLYLKQTGQDGSQREVLQEDFERLEKHRRGKGKRFYFAHLYKTSECTGAFKRTKGYLVKASLLYRGEKLPDDSPVLVIP